MKRLLALALSVSALASTSAFALPKAQAIALATHQAAAAARPAQVAAAKSATERKPAAVLVAENRKEFGSQYQRY
ncbi:hypothetical protein [Pseudomonas massiliensis]|uniref:hypothetical protein n=1 Tax=Pseudomonas massiliensis TaxID=522492 RepID=UPI00058CB99D|nr:hypothetical protein [Pseudomonas massiliensis]